MSSHVDVSRITLWLERIGIAFAVAFIYMGYFWINDWLVTNKIQPYHPQVWVDRVVPFSAPWIYIYALVLITAFWPILVVRHRSLFHRTALAYLLVQSCSWVCFLLVPVKTIHRAAELPTQSFVYWGVKLGYWLDLPYCCFPSLHVGMAVMAALACWKVDRHMGTLALIVAILISASTLFLKQHYFVDIVGGITLAYLAYRWLLAPYPTQTLSAEELRFPRGYSLVLIALYVLLVGGAYLAFRTGWTPWQH